MPGWHHQCNRCELGQTVGGGEGQEVLACFSSVCHRVRPNWATEQQKIYCLHTKVLSLSIFNIFQVSVQILSFLSIAAHLFNIFLALVCLGFPDSSVGKESTCNAGDPNLIPGPGTSSGEGIGYPLWYSWASLVAQLVKNLPTMRETWIQSLDWEDPLEKGMAMHSSILAWRIPWTIQLQSVRHN